AFHAEATGAPLAAGMAANLDGSGSAGQGSGQGSGDRNLAGTSLAGGIHQAGEIRSREDAVRELDRICAYLERHEPANPAPLLIRRAQRLVQMNFLDILRDLAPEGMSSIEKIAGLPPAE
ncbi:MAG: type VI secretion system protein TssA, partial [Lautropia sp.]